MVNWDLVKDKGWSFKKEGRIKILSIDGGGIKGIFPAQYLAYIEKETGNKIHEYFDLITGTSTGGIIALALSIGISAQKIADIYIERGREIFDARATGLLLFSKYNNKKLENILKEVLGDNKIKDSEVMLCIPSLEHYKAKPKVFKTPHCANFHIDCEYYMWQVALATSAAPTFFPAAIIDNDCKLDGGLWANNPIMIGIAEAIKLGIKQENIEVLSVGTGNKTYECSNTKAKKGGFLSYGKSLVELVMNAQSESAMNMAIYLLPKENYTRINFESSRKLSLDTIDKESIIFLQNEAKTAFANTYKNNFNVESKFF